MKQIMHIRKLKELVNEFSSSKANIAACKYLKVVEQVEK